jgi:SAM-dependent MidA family methyltransferase
MRQCLTAPEGGYYTRHTPGSDQFGAKGDFITSPEISQVFGELVGIWLYTEWLAQGRKDKVQIIEVGPGRGTLMDDVLRVCSGVSDMIGVTGRSSSLLMEIDYLIVQALCEKYRSHLSHRGITLPTQTTSTAPLRQ